MTPSEMILELRERQLRLEVKQNELVSAQEEIRKAQKATSEDLLTNTKETLRIGRSLEENTASTKRVEDIATRVENNTKNLVDAFQTGVKVYKVFDWLRRFLKYWAWLPASAIGAIGYFKGWWSKLW